VKAVWVWKEDHPVARWFMNLSYEFSHLGAALIGIRAPRPKDSGVDVNYAKLPSESLHAAMEHALHQMEAEGWTKDKWVPDASDCNHFLVQMYAKADQFLILNESLREQQKASPLKMIIYTQDKGGRHAVLKAWDEDGKFYTWHPYPWRGVEPFEMSQQEERSVSFSW